jgi:hypothetical protein
MLYMNGDGHEKCSSIILQSICLQLADIWMSGGRLGRGPTLKGGNTLMGACPNGHQDIVKVYSYQPHYAAPFGESHSSPFVNKKREQ